MWKAQETIICSGLFIGLLRMIFLYFIIVNQDFHLKRIINLRYMEEVSHLSICVPFIKE